MTEVLTKLSCPRLFHNFQRNILVPSAEILKYGTANQFYWSFFHIPTTKLNEFNLYRRKNLLSAHSSWGRMRKSSGHVHRWREIDVEELSLSRVHFFAAYYVALRLPPGWHVTSFTICSFLIASVSPSNVVQSQSYSPTLPYWLTVLSDVGDITGRWWSFLFLPVKMWHMLIDSHEDSLNSHNISVSQLLF